MTVLKQSAPWKSLQSHQKKMAGLHMRDLFAGDSKRFDSFSLSFHDIFLDYSKNLITDETMGLLMDLARTSDVEVWRERMFSGAMINSTEDRAVLHTALRKPSDQSVMVDGKNVMPQIHDVLDRMRSFTDNVRSGAWLGHTGKPITDIVNIGIGGSNLGPMMVCEALAHCAHPRLTMHFVSNIDGTHISDTLSDVAPETTMIIISSKTFTTQETMSNAHSARAWFIDGGVKDCDIAKHFVAVSSNVPAAVKFGISAANIFESWDWVGGRYSLWSATGLPIVLAIGMDNFCELLSGAHDMDEHFCQAPLDENMPVILAMLGVWYTNFFDSQSHAVLPYDHRLEHFITYLQQGDMESNGKSTTRNGNKVDYATGPIIWGMPGCDGQHAFFQHLHQGTSLVPTDFLVPIRVSNSNAQHHRILLANFFAQTEALMTGKTEAQVRTDLKAEGLDGERLESLLPHKIFIGNRPSNSILFERLNPKILGALLALYEHKIFVQGIIWNLNSFDQWGVELGKVLANKILEELNDDTPVDSHDCSTNSLINYIKLNAQKKADRSA